MKINKKINNLYYLLSYFVLFLITSSIQANNLEITKSKIQNTRKEKKLFENFGTIERKNLKELINKSKFKYLKVKPEVKK